MSTMKLIQGNSTIQGSSTQIYRRSTTMLIPPSSGSSESGLVWLPSWQLRATARTLIELDHLKPAWAELIGAEANRMLMDARRLTPNEAREYVERLAQPRQHIPWLGVALPRVREERNGQ